MPLIRALALVIVLVSGALGGSPVQARVATAAPTTVDAAAPIAAEDAATQARVLRDAYNLLLDRYVHPLDTGALLGAGWSQLAQDATAKHAPEPPPVPTFSGERAADLNALQGALADYLNHGTSPAGFVPVHALVRGMVHYVQENHTFFLDPQQYRDYQSWSRGENKYVGIGVSFSNRSGAPRIVEVYDGTPAQQAGLRPGDTLVRIDDHSVDGLATEEMSGLVRGTAGTSVRIEIRRGSDTAPFTFDIPRAEIQLQFVTQRTVGDDIGYVQLRGFPEPSVVDTIEQDIKTFQQDGVHGLVLDLRGNAGGRIDVGTRLLSDFLSPGSTIYEEVDRGGQNLTHTSPGGSAYDLPLVVLVDGGTASMGEIFASAVQEHGAATILGQNTAGSVAAAQVFGLPDGSGLQVTVFEILSGDGKALNRVGVAPDEVITPTSTDLASGTDPVLSRAVAILHATEDSAAAGPLDTSALTALNS